MEKRRIEYINTSLSKFDFIRIDNPHNLMIETNFEFQVRDDDYTSVRIIGTLNLADVGEKENPEIKNEMLTLVMESYFKIDNDKGNLELEELDEDVRLFKINKNLGELSLLVSNMTDKAYGTPIVLQNVLTEQL